VPPFEWFLILHSNYSWHNFRGVFPRHRQFYFASRSLRVSLFIIVLFSLATVLLFTFAVREVGEFLEKRGFQVQGNIAALAIVITGYAVIVFGLTYFFSHRFIGPFERLKTDMSIIRDGFYHRRLITRDGDDAYIRSFVDEVNKMLRKPGDVEAYKP